MSTRCNNCREWNDDDAVWCANCGARARATTRMTVAAPAARIVARAVIAPPVESRTRVEGTLVLAGASGTRERPWNLWKLGTGVLLLIELLPLALGWFALVLAVRLSLSMLGWRGGRRAAPPGGGSCRCSSASAARASRSIGTP
jgi:hypothetical protein